MPKNTVTDSITDQEIAFARVVLSGTMNDRRAATGMTYDAVLDRANPIRLSFSPNGRFSGRRR